MLYLVSVALDSSAFCYVRCFHDGFYGQHFAGIPIIHYCYTVEMQITMIFLDLEISVDLKKKVN